MAHYILFSLNKLAAWAILPSSTIGKQEAAQLNACFQAEWKGPSNKLASHFLTPKTITITTPDKVDIHARYFQRRGVSTNAPTLIVHQPNATTSAYFWYDWILAQLVKSKKDYNLITFDYRGVGNPATRPKSQKDLTLDADSVFQYANSALGVPAENIHLYGYSMGGAISAKLSELHPECKGRKVNDRSFTSINSMAQYGDIFIGALWPLRFLAQPFLSLLNWNIDPLSSLEKIKSPTLVVYHDEDSVIPKKANLHTALSGKNPHVRYLDLKTFTLNLRAPTHLASITDFTKGASKTQATAADSIGKFLFQ